MRHVNCLYSKNTSEQAKNMCKISKWTIDGCPRTPDTTAMLEDIGKCVEAILALPELQFQFPTDFDAAAKNFF
jgi:hypothetical protein